MPQRHAHYLTGEDSADAQKKRQVIGREVVLAVTNGKLDFGSWEPIFVPRVRRTTPEAGTGQSSQGVSFRSRVLSEVTWSDFERVHRDWDYSAPGTYVFDRANYETELQFPVRGV